MDVDIQKPDTGYLSVIERPSAISSHPTSKWSTHAGPTPAKTPTASSMSGSGGTNSPVAHVTQYTEPLSEGEEDEDEIIVAKDEEDETKRTGLSSEEVKAAIAYREQMLRARRDEEEEERKKQKKAGKDRYVGPSSTVGEIASAAEGIATIDGDAPAGNGGTFDRPKFYREASTISRNLKTSALAINPLAPSTEFDERLKSKLQGAQELEHALSSRHRRKRRSSRTHSRNTSIPRYKQLDDQAAENNEEMRADESEENGAPSCQYIDDRILERGWKAPQGKKIAVPVRIEPKVYFAAERTFLVCLTIDQFITHLLIIVDKKWLNNAVFIGTIATTLLNFIPPTDTRGLISAALFTFAALLAIAYSAGIFVYRSYRLRKRDAEGLYYDKYGPTLLCGILFLALATNIGLRWSQM